MTPMEPNTSSSCASNAVPYCSRSTGREQKLLVNPLSVLILLTVVLSHLALPGGPSPALGLVSLVPLAAALHGLRPLAAAAGAYLCAFLGWWASTSGLAIAFSAYVQGPALNGILAVVSACAVLAAPYGLFGLIYGRFQLPPFQAAACLTLIVCWSPTPLPIDSTHSLSPFRSSSRSSTWEASRCSASSSTCSHGILLS